MSLCEEQFFLSIEDSIPRTNKMAEQIEVAKAFPKNILKAGFNKILNTSTRYSKDCFQTHDLVNPSILQLLVCNAPAKF